MSRLCRQTTFYRKEETLEQKIAHAKMVEKAKEMSKQKEKESDMPTVEDSPTIGLKH